jgi:5-methylcytosine-specific restriction endonuclease McrA
VPYAPPKHRPPGWRPSAPKPTDPFYGSTLWKHLRERVRRRDRGICSQCGRPESWTVDHRIPRSLGGADAEWNLRLLCKECDGKRHSEKGRVWRGD